MRRRNLWTDGNRKDKIGFLRLANEFNGELISADSQQIYLGRDAETGKDKDIIGQSKVWLMDVLETG